MLPIRMMALFSNMPQGPWNTMNMPQATSVGAQLNSWLACTQPGLQESREKPMYSSCMAVMLSCASPLLTSCAGMAAISLSNARLTVTSAMLSCGMLSTPCGSSSSTCSARESGHSIVNISLVSTSTTWHGYCTHGLIECYAVLTHAGQTLRQ